MHSAIKYAAPKMFTDCIDASYSCTSRAHILFYATLEFKKALGRNRYFKTIGILALKEELNGEILLVCFFFAGYIFVKLCRLLAYRVTV